ncbi:acetyltransferase [Tatumella ptyseos ATCC 33301]|uniref:Acetyltransferase n=2 Tax=Tatumella ptyseos TaxID=82987 RepID=A0A085J9T8_9GAMM|nr:GNAT family N-acetyltransferase [Tatumella ptyseos]KFD17234.1 acetyltransferase [Tatumella ptyseos ATCC 33301]SQK72565.1 Predicted acetyltransferase [Tatumella ptyseos]
MTVRVREVQAEDHEAWMTLWKQYLAFAGSDLDMSVTLSTWERALSSDSPLMCRVAETDKKIIGFAIFVLHEGAWYTQPLCYLEDLFVDETMRGLGAGKALIEAIRDEAKEKSWAKVYWITRGSNPARKLYDRLANLEDFVRYSIRP